MDKVYKSKIGLWYHFIIILVVAGTVHSFMGTNILTMIAMLAVTVLVLHVLFNTYYVITCDGELIAHCSFFPEKKILISEIEAVEASAMPVSCYALSLDRIIIWTDGKPWMLVSPENNKHFVQTLQKYNSSIVIKK